MIELEYRWCHIIRTTHPLGHVLTSVTKEYCIRKVPSSTYGLLREGTLALGHRSLEKLV